MATAEEKQALGLGPDATEAEITSRIDELKEAAALAANAVHPDQLAEAEERARLAEERAADAQNAKASSDSENAELRRVASMLREAQTAPSDVTGATPSVPSHHVAQASETNVHGLLDVPGGNPITIKIRAFPYYVDVEDPVTLRPMRQECIATRGMTVRVSDVDFRRATKFKAYYTEEELAERDQIAQGSAQPDLEVATVADISHWLQTAKPSIGEVVAEVNNDPDVAKKVLAAENHATGGQPREELVDELEEITNG
jgi:hypothetical protein